MPIDPSTIQWDTPAAAPAIDLASVKWDEDALPLSKVPGQVIVNAPASAAKFAGDIYTAVTNPVQTAGGLVDLARGGLRAAGRAVLPERVANFLDTLDAPENIERASK